MNIQQLRYLQEIVRHDLNISQAAETLYTSQPGISKQIRQLEEELGIEIFVRNGKRIASMTEPGQQILEIAQRLLLEADNLKRVGQEFRSQDTGTLTIATTHTQARYALPLAVKRFIQRYPGVKLNLHQGNPTQVAEQALRGEADIAIATETLDQYDELVTLPCYEWHHCLITPLGHPLLEAGEMTLEKLAGYPLITYDAAFSGRGKIDQAFRAAGVAPNIVLTAIDTDVIKTYVELGLGVGLIAEMAYLPERDMQLRSLPLKHLFPANVTRLALRRNEFVRGYTYHFIELFAPQLTREIVLEALRKTKAADQ